MSVLQQLHSLDGSSQDFHDKLDGVLCGKEYEQCVQELRDADAASLVHYLDWVRRCVRAPIYSLLKLAY